MPNNAPGRADRKADCDLRDRSLVSIHFRCKDLPEIVAKASMTGLFRVGDSMIFWWFLADCWGFRV